MLRNGKSGGGKTAESVTDSTRAKAADAFAAFASGPENKIGKLANMLRRSEGDLKVSGLAGGSGLLVACLVCKFLKSRLLYICKSEENRIRTSRAIAAFTGEKPPAEEENEISFLSRAESAPVICASLENITKKIVSPNVLKAASTTVNTGDEKDRDEFAERLCQMGYRKRDFACLCGEISIRGAIVDIARPGGARPVRVEFSGDTIRSIRFFDSQSQSSTGKTDGICILPVLIDGDDDKADSSLFDYFQKGCVIFVEEKNGESTEQSLKNLEQSRLKTSGAHKHFSADRINQKISEQKTVSIKTSGGEIDFQTSAVLRTDEKVAPGVQIVNSAEYLVSKGYRLKIFLANRNETEKIREILLDKGVKGAEFHTGTSAGSFVFPEIGTAFIDGSDFTQKTPAKSPAEGNFPGSVFEHSFGEIKNGDLLVHRELGIGIFRGLKTLEIRGTQSDFIECEYHGGDSVYVPVSKFRLLHRYVGGEDNKPRIDKLGGVSWIKTVTRAKKATETVAKDLLDLYASRKSCQGHSFSKPDADFRQFEMDFTFEETDGQKKAIEDVMEDMESPRSMDRLICGDTGFGKTEVALRAAFKAAMDGFQVAFITPTTLLVNQHLETARRRLEKFPVNVAGFSRFNTPNEEKKILSGIESGTADIIIGTHKLLGSRVKFRNLGLLIIDEEHKFGVRHKEKLKKMKENLDVISLSATPIPRTLQLSLTGIRDISPINSPPHGRIPVKISIEKWNEKLIRSLVLREKNRGGNVFFIHNRIGSMYRIAECIAKAVPEISIETAHGRMSKKTLRDTIERFAGGKTDMLVTTAIVESGLDITRANTIIINDAHTFGMADLYQLKGRVGRGSLQAYACLLVPEGKTVNEEAWRRLERFSRLWDFGSGYELAFSDLRMRGVGNLFGVEQSGHVAGVGVEFYLEMLREAVEKLKTGKTAKEIEPEIKTNIEALIPGNYVKNGSERLVLYKRISSAPAITEINSLKKEIKDRFGPVPPRLNNLFAIAALKITLKKHSVGFMKIEENRAEAYIEKGGPETAAVLHKNGRTWKLLSGTKLPGTAAAQTARLLSSIKPV